MQRLRASLTVVVLLLVAAGAFAQTANPNADAISGNWVNDAGRTLLDVKADAAGAVSGTGYFQGGPSPTVLPIRSGRFDPFTRILRVEGEVVLPGSVTPATWTIEGVLDGDSLRASAAVGGTPRGTMAMRRGGPPRAAGDPVAAAAPGTVLVTGANRGLGFEFAKQYAARGWTVIATARTPEAAADLRALAAATGRVTVERLDVRDRAAIAALAAKYRGTPIDLLINNAGIGGDVKGQTLGSFDYTVFEESMAVNTYGALAMAESFREHVAASRHKKLVAIASGWGVFGLPRPSGPYFYRASKAALNMVMHALAVDLRESGVIVGLVAPGAADTELRRQLQGNSNAPPPAEPVAAMIKVIDGLTLENSERPFNFDGSVLPW